MTIAGVIAYYMYIAGFGLTWFSSHVHAIKRWSIWANGTLSEHRLQLFIINVSVFLAGFCILSALSCVGLFRPNSLLGLVTRLDFVIHMIGLDHCSVMNSFHPKWYVYKFGIIPSKVMTFEMVVDNFEEESFPQTSQCVIVNILLYKCSVRSCE